MKETLEEVAEKLYSDKLYPMYGSIRRDAFINGAKWQMETNYSEEELDLLNKMFNLYWIENNSQHEDNLEEWEFSKRLFEQFKKK